jgi:hypothetical protein
VLSLRLSESGIGVIGGGSDVDDPRFDSYKLSMSAIARRPRMVRAVHDEALIPTRDSCVAELEKTRAEVARFYGRSE